MNTPPIQMALSEPIKCRLEGLPLDVEIMTATLRVMYNVTNVSLDRANIRGRRDHVRRYITIETQQDFNDFIEQGE